jgi:hypothetical protein
MARIEDPAQPVKFTLIDDPFADLVLRRCYCRACNLARDVRIRRELVAVLLVKEEEPTPEQLGDPCVHMIDAMTGGPERRRERKEANRIVDLIDQESRALLTEMGCQHLVPPATASRTR